MLLRQGWRPALQAGVQRWRPALGITLTLALAMGGCGYGSSSDSSGGNGAATVSGDIAAARIAGFAFNPVNLTVDKGARITWTNEDAAGHTVSEDTGKFESGRLSSGQKFTFAFDEPGTFSYHCSIHPNMKAQITVK